MVTLEQLNEIAGMLSEHDSADDDETLRVAVQSMAKLLAELYHLRRQVTELQAHNTARQERARAAAQEREETRAECERMRVERAEARTETQRAQFALDGVRRERDEARAALAMCGNALDAYQLAAMRTTIHARGDAGANALTWNALGIAGEAGEVADLIKKHVGHGHELDRAKLTRELGDVLWYVAALAHDIGVDLSTVARENVEKLKARYPDGFSQERSRNRVAE